VMTIVPLSQVGAEGKNCLCRHSLLNINILDLNSFFKFRDEGRVSSKHSPELSRLNSCFTTTATEFVDGPGMMPVLRSCRRWDDEGELVDGAEIPEVNSCRKWGALLGKLYDGPGIPDPEFSSCWWWGARVEFVDVAHALEFKSCLRWGACKYDATVQSRYLYCTFNKHDSIYIGVEYAPLSHTLPLRLSIKA
jgi:hypothetical protein